MTTNDLWSAWPEYWATHDISRTELVEIAARSGSVDQAHAAGSGVTSGE